MTKETGKRGLTPAMRRVARTWPKRYHCPGRTIYRRGKRTPILTTGNITSTEMWEHFLSRLPVPMGAWGEPTDTGLNWWGLYRLGDDPNIEECGGIAQSRRSAFMAAVVAALNHSCDEWERTHGKGEK